MSKDLSILGFFQLVSDIIDREAAKDGIEVILKPDHHFRCLACSRKYRLRYDAMHCKHDGSGNPLKDI